MAKQYNNQAHFALSKDISMGGVRLLSTISPLHYESLPHHQRQQQQQQFSNNFSSVSDADQNYLSHEDRHDTQSFSTDQVGEGGTNNGVTMISTTQSEIERAQSDMKNKHINPKSV